MTDDPRVKVARAMHDAYERAAVRNAWKTQTSCQVPFDELPEENQATMLEAVDAALDAADKAAWRPIETAPQDTAILVYRPRLRGRYFTERMEVDAYVDGRWARGERGLQPPTHWMPLPTPPSSDGDG